MSPKGAPKIAIVVTFGWKSYQLRAALQQHVLLSRVPHVIDATVLHRVHGWFKTLPKCCDSFLCGKNNSHSTHNRVLRLQCRTLEPRSVMATMAAIICMSARW